MNREKKLKRWKLYKNKSLDLYPKKVKNEILLTENIWYNMFRKISDNNRNQKAKLHPQRKRKNERRFLLWNTLEEDLIMEIL